MKNGEGILFLVYLVIELRFFARLPLLWGEYLERKRIGSRYGRESQSCLGQLRSRFSSSKHANLSL